MKTEMEAQPPHHTPFLRRVLAGLVLVVVVVLAFKLVIGFVMGIFWLIVGVAALLAVLWALKTLFW